VGFTRQFQIALLSLVASFFAGVAFAESITIRPGADTSLFAAFPDNNLGATENFVVGANGSGAPGRGLVRFVLAGQVPAGAVIQSVTLTVKVVSVPPGGGVSSVFDVRRVLRDWGEGIGTGNTGTAANSGEATWNNRFHPTTGWSVPGGTVTNDFSGIVSASLLFADLGGYTFTSTPELVADVQQWLLNPATNLGWVLISQSEDIAFTARRLGSRESTGNEPTLTIQYAAPPPPNIQWIKSDNGQMQFSFTAQAGQHYTAQFRDALTLGTWLTLTNVAPQLMTTNVTLVDPFPTNTQRYYRLGAF